MVCIKIKTHQVHDNARADLHQHGLPLLVGAIHNLIIAVIKKHMSERNKKKKFANVNKNMCKHTRTSSAHIHTHTHSRTHTI